MLLYWCPENGTFILFVEQKKHSFHLGKYLWYTCTPAGRAFTSDWSANSFIIILFEKIILGMLWRKITSNDHSFGCPVICTDTIHNAWYNNAYSLIEKSDLAIMVSNV